MRKYITDEEVEAEIARLTKSEDVQLARANDRLRYKRRQKLYQLRNLEKRGKVLRQEGMTLKRLYELDQEGG